MAKNQAIIAPDFLGQLSMVYVTERLGIRPEQHQLTSEGAWIRLAERLMKTQHQQSVGQHQELTDKEEHDEYSN